MADVVWEVPHHNNFITVHILPNYAILSDQQPLKLFILPFIFSTTKTTDKQSAIDLSKQYLSCLGTVDFLLFEEVNKTRGKTITAHRHRARTRDSLSVLPADVVVVLIFVLGGKCVMQCFGFFSSRNQN